MEPLLQHIRTNEVIAGIEIDVGRHKVAAYADDLLFFVTNPEGALTINIIKIINIPSDRL